MHMMDSPVDFTGPVNIGNPKKFSMFELAETAIYLTGNRAKIIHQSLPSDDPKRRRPDITLAKEKLHWEPRVTLVDGLKEASCFKRYYD
jgi:UDP-glucuronate decarboxylase